jgi:HK97 family phage major capsid protein
MSYEEYLAKREALKNEAKSLFAEGKRDEAYAKKDEVKELENAWEEQCKFEREMHALDDNQPKINMMNYTATAAPKSQTVTDSISMTQAAPKKEDVYKTEEYTNAWAKVMMGQQMSADEDKAFRMVNEAYTHTAENTPVVIPDTVAAGIWKEIGDMYPYWDDVRKTYVQGKVTIIKQTGSSEAAWYVESVKTEDGKELLEKQELNGCELSRAITISWKLKERAIPDFLDYITSQMAEEMGKGLAYGATHGAGVVEGKATEPLGVVTALKKEEDTPQVVTYTAGKLSYKDLTTARGKVKSGYNPAIYANSNTIWNTLANVMDGNDRPIFIADAMNGGVYRILGCIVKEDGSMKDGEVLFSDAEKGYQANINKQISVLTEEHAKERITDYCGYAIADGAPVTTKAHALLTAGE